MITHRSATRYIEGMITFLAERYVDSIARGYDPDDVFRVIARAYDLHAVERRELARRCVQLLQSGK